MSEPEAIPAGKKKKKKKWPWILLVIFLILISVVFLIYRRITKAIDTLSNSIESYTAEQGSITSTVVGTGNLSYDKTQDVDALTGITVNKVNVDVGDHVAKGDALATLDPVSVEQAIADAQQQVNSLARQLYDENSDDSDSIKAVAAGRIKLINAQEGDSVEDVMTKYGALMVLSMDGKMAVDIPVWDGAGLGDTVTVQLSSGADKTGTISDIANNVATVTVSDNGPKYGDTVVVYHDVDQVGSGTLYIHHPVEVVGTEGVIDDVKYSENTTVSIGTVLFTLRDLPLSAAYQQIKDNLQKWEAQLISLMELEKSNAILAPFDGVVQSVVLTDGQSVQGDGMSLLAFTLSPTQNMLLPVEVDELDIPDIQPGQTATVSVDAIKGETFNGIITDVSDAGVITGGAAKFTVEVTVPYSDGMRAGMTATATIITDTSSNIIVVPAEAIQEYGNEEFVYTACNAKTGELSGKQTVTSGLSDGQNTEITSGLSEGTTIYYQPAGSATDLSGIFSSWRSAREANNDNS